MDWPFSEKFMDEFFEMYKSMPSLWDQRTEEFRNRVIRGRDCEKLLKKFKEVEPEMTKANLLKVLCGLRRQYRYEWRKCREQGRPMKKGLERLSFLPDPSLLKHNRLKKDPLDIESSSDNDESLASALGDEDRQKPRDFPLNEVNDQVHTDRIDHATKAWTASLQIMPRHQQIIAERIINNILFEAQVGNLSKRSPIEVSKLLHTNW